MSAVALSGCGVGASSEALVETSTTSELGTIQGSNYGGHAPVTGSKVFVLEATTNGYGAIAKSLLTSTYYGSYPTAKDSSGSVTNGMYYVTTDSSGSFNITGDYTCDVGQPVYLYAAGGNPATRPAVTLTGFSISSNVVTFTATSNLIYQGESITVAGVPAAYSYLNGTYTVSSTGLTTNSFQVSLTHANVGSTTLSSGTASQANAPSNPAIVNMAMLGLCPSSGNFTNSLSYVYMNEVSTVAMSYAMAGFAVDSLHIGSSSTNLIGLQNAALNSNTLYNIQGNGPSSTTLDGEGHIANSVNPNNGNGTVPQATINTLANIVANCVDSANTSVGTSAAALQAESAGCSGLFTTATSNGVPVSTATGGTTVPIDTATAMINLAHYPAGINNHPTNSYVDSPNPSTLFALPTGNVPYTPQLATAPTDWTIALTYKNIATPVAIAIDASGDAYVGTSSGTAGYITELGPQGAVNATSTVSVPNLYGVAISTANIVWATSNSNSSLYKFSSSLATSSSYTSAYTLNPTALAVDSSGNVYVANNSANYHYFYVSEFNSSGAVINTPAYIATSGNSNFANTNGMALTKASDLWLSQNNNTFSLYPNPSTGNVNATANGGTTNISAIAVDFQGHAWITAKQGPGGNQDLMWTTGANTGTEVSYGLCGYDNCSIGGLNNPVAVAVDGSNANNGDTFNVWVANSGNSTVTEVNSSSLTNALSPSVGYQSGTGSVNNPSAIAVDNAGNVWVTNQGNSTVTEIIGSANPVTTPLSAQKPGVEP